MVTRIKSLENRYDTLKKSLASSYSSNRSPTSREIRTGVQIDAVNKQIDDLKSKQIRNKWYGPSDFTTKGDTQSKSDGFFISGLKALQRPLNAIIGTGQYLLGKGTKSNLGANINEAMKTGLTAGNVLQQIGVPRGIQVPLGFALDVALDPINWLTVGTSALIPRIGTGLVKGTMEGGIKAGLEAAGKGAISGLEKNVVSAMNFVPFVKKISKLAPELEKTGLERTALSRMITKGAIKYTDLTKKLGTGAIKSADEYNSLIGRDIFDRLNKTPLGFKSGLIGRKIESTINKIPKTKFTPKGEDIVDFFKYSPIQEAKMADLNDKVINLSRDKNIMLVNTPEGANFIDIKDALKPGATFTIPGEIKKGVDGAIKSADEVVSVKDSIDAVKVYNTKDNAKTLLEIAGEDYNLKHLEKIYKTTARGKTGVKVYDDWLDKVKSTTIDDITKRHLGTGDLTKIVKVDADNLVKKWNSYDKIKDLRPFEKILVAQEKLLSIFKSAKVPMNAASHVVANLGNLVMGSMMGLPMWKPEYIASIIKGNLLVKGKLGAAGFKEMFFNDFANSLIKLADESPTRFRQLTGMDARELASKLTLEEKITHVLNSKTTISQAKKIIEEGLTRAEEGLARGTTLESFQGSVEKVAKLEKKSPELAKVIKEGRGRFKTPSEQTAQMLKEAPLRRGQEFGSFTTSEINGNNIIDFTKNYVTRLKGSHPYNPAVILADTLLSKMPRWYEHIDQSFKIGTADYLTKIGLTEKELNIVSRTINIFKGDTLEPIIKNGERLYRITPLKASEIATEAFMNYAAMPDFVRVMRALPIVGSPFLSFPYAMAIKTAKTAIDNPALFNKVGFFINEMNASRTPQEKVAMEEKYNQYLKSPTVIKMFGMWNTNVKNIVPYYQMNMFNPSERSYKANTFGSKLMELSDKFPVMQTPIGSVVKDYLIQPWLLSGSGEPSQGQFGQPIYPSYDENGKQIKPSLGTKAFYGARTFAETVVPGSFSYLGAPFGPLMSPEAINYIPSYGFRNVANATQGRSTIGATTKEDAVRKTFRALLGRSGLPAYTLDTTKTNTLKKY